MVHSPNAPSLFLTKGASERGTEKRGELNRSYVKRRVENIQGQKTSERKMSVSVALETHNKEKNRTGTSSWSGWEKQVRQKPLLLLLVTERRKKKRETGKTNSEGKRY